MPRLDTIQCAGYDAQRYSVAENVRVTSTNSYKYEPL